MLRAEALLLDATAEESSAPHWERCWRLAAEGRRHWLAAARGWAECLPLLAAKLGRLQQLEERFAETLEREKLEAMAEFAAGAGHEINNPLTVIAGRAQLFLRQETDPERRRALALVNAQAMRVYEMIADMRLFARPPEPQREPTDLVALADRVAREISARAAEQETLVCRSGESEPVVVEVDPAQWGVALAALCHNALDALARQGHLEISVRRVGPAGGDSRRRRRPRHQARRAPPSVRSVLLGAAGGSRIGDGPGEVLADRHQSRRPHRSP